MRNIAIVGAGQAGLLAAHDLLRHGYEVTLYSDKTPEDFLQLARPTGAAARFDNALSYERELGLEHWSGQAPDIGGFHLHFSAGKDPGNALLTLVGRLGRPALAVDLRLQSATWMREFEERGGKVEIGTVSLARLDEVAAVHDLVVVAAGRGDIQRIFPRDEARSRWTRPQRNLAMVCVTGPDRRLPYGPAMTPVKFNLFARYGEMFWVPWYSKDGASAWSLVFEAKPGGPLDVFGGVTSAYELLARAVPLVGRFCPWDAEWIRDAEPCDENSWLVGAFTPEVRGAVGTLPSGRHVMALGDTAQSVDPIAGQGANNGNDMARNLVHCIRERAELPFDETWMRGAFDRFWALHHGREDLTNTLLQPLSKAGQSVLISQYGSTGMPEDSSPQQLLADRFCDNFNDPTLLTDALDDPGLARKAVAEVFGDGQQGRAVRRGKRRIVTAQLRHGVRRPANHPGTDVRHP